MVVPVERLETGRQRIERAVVVAMLAFGLPFTEAAEFCVDSSIELQAALDVAASNNESDIIRISEGSYPSPPVGFIFSPVGSANLDDDLQLSGGWSPLFILPCVVNTPDPALTTLDGGGLEPVMQIDVPSLGDVDIRFLTFANGSADLKGSGAGLRLINSFVYAGRLTVAQNVFYNNSAGIGSGLYMVVFGSTGIELRVLNNLFLDNSAVLSDAAAGLVAQIALPERSDDLSGNDPGILSFAHNTVVENQSVGASGGMLLRADSIDLNVASNNLWGNSGDDLVVTAEGTSQNLYVLNNNIQSLRLEGTTTPTISDGNINVQPVSVACGPACLERVPVVQSPLVNAGFDPASLGLSWTLPLTDAAAAPRLDGPQVDIGAFEAMETLFSDRFED
jgi:hypothetical protein